MEEKRSRGASMSGLYIPKTQDSFFSEANSTVNNHMMFYGEMGDELAPDAKIWPLYVQETEEHDKGMIAGWHGSIDVLLIFAGLFSTVLTAFIVLSQNALLPDNQAITAALLYDISITLKSIAPNNNNNATIAIPANSISSLPPFLTQFQPSYSAILVNALWFASLGCSLATSLAAMLAKQWLHAYSANLAGTSYLHARTRQYRYDGVQKWFMPHIIGLLPTLLHISLVLFLAGLVLFLQDLNSSIAWATVALVVLTLAFYTVTTLLPIWYTDCPFKSPLSGYLASLLRSFSTRFPRLQIISTEAKDIERLGDKLVAKAISWLVLSSRKVEVVDAATQSISGAGCDFTANETFRTQKVISVVKRRLFGCFRSTGTQPWNVLLQRGSQMASAAYARAFMSLISDLPPNSESLRGHEYYDLHYHFLHMAKDTSTANIEVATSAICAAAHYSRVLSDPNTVFWLERISTNVEDHVSGTTTYSEAALSLLVHTFGDCASILEDTPRSASAPRFLIILLKLLTNVTNTHDSTTVHGPLVHAIATTIGILVLGHKHSPDPEEDDRVLIPSLVSLVDNPSRFGLSPEEREIAAHELMKRITPITYINTTHTPFLKDSGVPQALISMAHAGFSEDVVLEALTKLHVLFPTLDPRNFPEGTHITLLHAISSGKFTHQMPAASALAVMAQSPDQAQKIVSEEAFAALLPLLGSPSQRLVKIVQRALCSLVYGCTQGYATLNAKNYAPKLDIIVKSRVLETISTHFATHETTHWWEISLWAEALDVLLKTHRREVVQSKLIISLMGLTKKLPRSGWGWEQSGTTVLVRLESLFEIYKEALRRSTL